MNLTHLMRTREWVYWLDETAPDPLDATCFRVSVVVAGESGHFPTGSGDKAPWYWDKATCDAQNKERGFTPEQVHEIVMSSMFQKQ